jgi:CheY-like chemotaxis protein
MESEKLSPSHRDFLRIIKSSGKLLLAVIGDILDISKIEAGQMHVKYAPFSIRETLNDVASNAMGLLSRKGSKRLKIKGPSVDSGMANENFCDLMIGDSSRIIQVTNNLMSNAIKFTDSGTVEFGACLVSNESNSSKTVEFFVKDTGPGIPPEHQDLIFQPFRQSNASGSSHNLGGTGLGLAIASRLAELMGGNLRLELRPGSGSSFFLSIPYVQADQRAPEDAMGKIHARDMRRSSTSHALSGKILLVDDSKVNLKLAEQMIHKMGCTSVSACDGLLAVKMFERDPTIKLILMDKEMPHMDGLSATREIRRIEAMRHASSIPIIALTAAVMSSDKAKCLEAGCTDYLSKPIDPEKLHRLLKRYLL